MINDGSLEEFGTESNEINKKCNDAPECEGENKTSSSTKDSSYEFIQWAYCANETYTPTGKTQDILDPSVYSVAENNDGDLFFHKEKLNTDELIEFKDSITNEVLEEIEKFWNRKSIFQTYGFLHRRGYIFYGKAGCGKSALIYLIASKIIKRNGIVLLCGNPYLLTRAIKMIREIEPERHIVIIFEDIDAIIRGYGEEPILNFLDGEAQCGDILNIATTNYPERLDKRIINRPRRFDRRIKMSSPSSSVRREYFIKKFRLDEKDDIEKWVNATEGFSFAGLTDLIIQVKCLDVPFEEAVSRLNNLLKQELPSSDKMEGNVLGFQP